MGRRRYIVLTALYALVVSACSPVASPSPPPSSVPVATPTASPSASPSPSASAVAASPTALAPDRAEAVITGVEPDAEIGFWTFDLSPAFDQYIEDTIARFEATYPGVTVKWEDHGATFQADLTNAFNSGIGPDVINLSVSEGWVSDYAGKDQLLGLSVVPKTVQDIYFPGLWNEQLVDGENFQFPWYQVLDVELINKKIYQEDAGLSVVDFPKTIAELPDVCQTIKDKTGTPCDIHLTVDDLLGQMVYEGDVKVINDAGTAFTFDSKAGVQWLQMYVDMVAAGTVDDAVLTAKDDRVGELLFAAGQAAFYVSSPDLVRQIKSTNPTLYENLEMRPSPVGKSGVLGKGLMSISVNKATKFPNASIALAQFFTNPRSMVEFAKQVAIYPSSPAAYDDPFFSDVPTAVEDGARPLAEDIISTYKDIVPPIPKKADVNQIVLAAIESALLNKVRPQEALSDAVDAANKLIQ